VNKQHIPKSTTSALGFIAICVIVVGVWDIFPVARSKTIALQEQAPEEEVWFDDALPAGAVAEASGGDSWNWVSSSPEPKSGSASHISNLADWSNWSPPPYSGNLSHQSNIASGGHQHFFWSSSQKVPVRSGGKLYAYIYIDPENIPEEVMLQWGEPTQGWEHRAYWGANKIGYGTDGTASRRYMGPLPAAGGWVRLEAPAWAVGLEGKTVDSMAFTLYGGRANWDLAGVEGLYVGYERVCEFVCPPDPMECFERCQDIPHEVNENYVIVDDSIPAGATPFADGGDGWNWTGARNVDMVHQHYFYNASNTLQVSAGEKLFAWVYLDPAYTPSEVMLQWNVNGSWEHRAYWGANRIGWGVDGTTSRRYMGPLPQAGGWVKLAIPTFAVGLEGKVVNGMAFTLYGGRAAWDKAGKFIPSCVANVPTDRWRGEYYNNTALAGSPAMTRNDGDGFLNFDWGGGGPSTDCDVNADNFSARWTRTVNFEAGLHRFSVTGDDGVRLYVDGQLKIDAWGEQPPTTYTADVSLSAGPHEIKLEYFEGHITALAFLSWRLLTVPNCLQSAPLIGAAPRTSAGQSIATTPASDAPGRCGQKSSD
jgi:hypothetical protein